jgi:hypothetical protein
MKSLKEYISREGSKGTYAELVLSNSSASQLSMFCSEYNIPCIDKSKLHCTVVYSRNPIDIDESIVKLPVNASVTGYTILPSPVKTSKALALSINSDYMLKLHLYFKSRGATFDFAEYHPHLTLNYDWHGNHKKLPVPNLRLVFDRFNVEEIEVNWSADVKP